MRGYPRVCNTAKAIYQGFGRIPAHWEDSHKHRKMHYPVPVHVRDMESVQPHADVVAKRRDVLAALSTPKTKPEIVESISISRSTVDRAIDSLSDHGFVERDGSEYVTTYAGREAVAAYEGLLGRLRALDRARPVLDALDPDADVPPAILEGASVDRPSPEAPETPIERTIERIEGASSLCGISPVLLSRYVDVCASLAADEAAVELLLTDGVLERLPETYPDGFVALAESDHVSIFAVTEAPPYSIWLAEHDDGPVGGFVVFSESGVAGAISNDTPAMVEWVRGEYDRLKRDADRLV